MEEDNSFNFEKEALRVSILPYYDCGDLVDVKDYINGKIFDDSYNIE